MSSIITDLETILTTLYLATHNGKQSNFLNGWLDSYQWRPVNNHVWSKQMV